MIERIIVKLDIWELGICIYGIDVAVITFIVIVLFMGPFIILLTGHLARVHHYHYNLTNIILIIVFLLWSLLSLLRSTNISSDIYLVSIINDLYSITAFPVLNDLQYITLTVYVS